MGEESDGYEAGLIDAGFLTPVLAKHQKVFGDPGKLPATNLPKVKIETESRALVTLHLYRIVLSK